MWISAEEFWKILFGPEAFKLADWKTKHNGVDYVITPKRFEEARDLASAIKKVCPEVIPTIVEAARPYETFLRFLEEK